MAVHDSRPGIEGARGAVRDRRTAPPPAATPRSGVTATLATPGVWLTHLSRRWATSRPERGEQGGNGGDYPDEQEGRQEAQPQRHCSLDAHGPSPVLDRC